MTVDGLERVGLAAVARDQETQNGNQGQYQTIREKKIDVI